MGTKHEVALSPKVNDPPSRAEVPPEGTGWLECTIQTGNGVLPPGLTPVVIE